jgi:hypothetical protein
VAFFFDPVFVFLAKSFRNPSIGEYSFWQTIGNCICPNSNHLDGTPVHLSVTRPETSQQPTATIAPNIHVECHFVPKVVSTPVNATHSSELRPENWSSSYDSRA